MRSMKLAMTLSVLLPLAACTQNETIAPITALPADLADTPDPPDYPDVPTSLRELSGLWVLEGGSMMEDFVKGLATYSTTTDVKAIRINDDGTGRVWLLDRLTGTKDAVQAYVIFDDTDGSLVFDFAAEKTTDVVYNIAIETYSYTFPFVTVESGWLGIADAVGHIALLSSQTSLPSDIALDEFNVFAEYSVPPPQFFGDLACYGDELIFNSSSQIETFDPVTGTLGDPLGPTSSRLVQTTEGPYFWTHCGCGGSRDAFKRTLTSVHDTVSSEDEMGGPITFRGMAYHASSNRLWLHGRPFDSQSGQFYVMNTTSEPDVVEETIAFNRDIRGMAFDGNELWAVVTVASQSVVRIDLASGDVLQTFEIPDLDVSWSGLEVVSDTIYMLGTDLDGNGVIFEVGMVPRSVPETRDVVAAPIPTGFEARLAAQVAAGSTRVDG